ncbi:MAG: hypothetical protein HZC44_11300, partial [Geobacter sp.]|nr:hypothetical protein [Geobacter sp.]
LSSNSPTAPELIDEPDIAEPGGSVTVTLQWNAVVDPDGNAVQYQVQIDDFTNFVNINYTSGWQSGTSWTVSVSAPARYYWRVQARDADHPTLVSAWTAADSFAVSNPSAPPSPAIIAEPDGSIADYWFPLTLEWSTSAGATAYYAELSMDAEFATVYTASGWLAGTSWNLTVDTGYSYYWRVMASNGSYYSVWSVFDAFYVECTVPTSSCPFIYVWDGEKFVYETDAQRGMIGNPAGHPMNASIPLYGPQYLVLYNLRPAADNLYYLKIREALSEADYIDQTKLLLVDHPAGYEIVSSTAENTLTWNFDRPFKLYAIKDVRPPLAAFDQLGNNILDKVLALDSNPAPANIGIPEYYVFDFGAIAHPEYAKLVLDGWTLYKGKKTYSQSTTGLTPIEPYVELVNAQGQWEKVLDLGMNSGDLKTMVVDLSGFFMSSDHRIRLNLGFYTSARWVVDRVRLDDSAPVDLIVTEVDLNAAELYHGGRPNMEVADLTHPYFIDDDNLPDAPIAYFYGAFTRYGDVLPVLLNSDDKMVLMRHGDEMALAFPTAYPPDTGMERTAVLKIDSYYSRSSGKQVEPMPYHGMTTYPPDPWLGPT